MKLGKLQEIDIREVWTHEQYDFSKWLSAEDNIQELGNVLNLSLSDIETEKFVGSYTYRSVFCTEGGDAPWMLDQAG